MSHFDGNVADGVGGARFVIRGSDCRMIAACGVQLVDNSMLGAELRAAWEGITQMMVLLIDRLIVEEDSSVVVA